MFAVAGPLEGPLALSKPSLDVDRDAPPSFLSRIWLELDAVPYVVDCRGTQFSLAGEAVRAVELALDTLSPTTTNIVKAGTSAGRREVLVDAAQQVHLYDLHQQAALTSPGLWETFAALACPLRKHRTTVSFFSATARGGGVALMRHALVRVWRASPLSCFRHTCARVADGSMQVWLASTSSGTCRKATRPCSTSRNASSTTSSKASRRRTRNSGRRTGACSRSGRSGTTTSTGAPA